MRFAPFNRLEIVVHEISHRLKGVLSRGPELIYSLYINYIYILYEIYYNGLPSLTMAIYQNP